MAAGVGLVGETVGLTVGLAVGLIVGESVGLAVGGTVGLTVGLAVGRWQCMYWTLKPNVWLATDSSTRGHRLLLVL